LYIMSDIQSFPSTSNTPSSTSINWPEQIESWKKSGLSQAAYCRQSKISYSSFLYWRRKSEDNSSPSSEISFVQLENPISDNTFSIGNSLDSSLATSSGILILIDPLSVTVGTNFSPATLAQVIRIFRSL
jgi:transposase